MSHTEQARARAREALASMCFWLTLERLSFSVLVWPNPLELCPARKWEEGGRACSEEVRVSLRLHRVQLQRRTFCDL